MKLFANILQTEQRKEITEPLQTRAVTAYAEEISSSSLLHTAGPYGCFEEDLSLFGHCSMPPAGQSAPLPPRCEDLVGDIWDLFSEQTPQL